MNQEKQIYGLIGFPLGHSFSKAYFTEKFERYGINAEYRNFEIPDLKLLPELLSEYPELKGFNVTIPYKERIISYLDNIEDVASEIGAVNVVKVTDNHRLVGYNSDVFGFIEALKPFLTGKEKKAIVLGTGGASKAVKYGLQTLGIASATVSRTAGAADYTYDELTEAVIKAHLVIVNATPVGMSPYVDDCPDILYDALTPNHLCFDLIYNPLETLFMKKSAQCGAKVSNGLKMLHLQAEKAWEIWNS